MAQPSSSISAMPVVASNWTFVTSEPGAWRRIKRATLPIWRGRPAPSYRALKPTAPRDCWFVYFVFAPTGQLNEGHRYTLARLRDMNRGVLVVCAAPEAKDVPAELFDMADALYWKALPGYDFSAYAIALKIIADSSPGARTLVLNDSVFGPFADLRPFVDGAAWDLTGFTASWRQENHLQSYAFVVRDLDRQRLAHLRPAIRHDIAFDEIDDVILCQELYFARVASRHMSVGAYWYDVSGKIEDPTLMKPLELLDAGFPFMKKSLFAKHSGFQVHAHDALRARLASLGHHL